MEILLLERRFLVIWKVEKQFEMISEVFRAEMEQKVILSFKIA